MSKLDIALLDLHKKLRPDLMFQPDAVEESMELSKSKEEIKTLILDLIGQPEQRETEDMTLNSWTPDDYKAFGRNELQIELINKIKAL